MNNVEIIAGVATLVVSVIGLFLAVRSELKRQADEAMKIRLEDERRHARHEQRLDAIEKITELFGTMMSCRYPDISSCICRLYDNILPKKEKKSDES